MYSKDNKKVVRKTQIESFPYMEKKKQSFKVVNVAVISNPKL